MYIRRVQRKGTRHAHSKRLSYSCLLLPGERARRGTGPHGGEALLYFAGDNDVAQPSLRYMAVRQGMTDVKYLQKLREVGKNSPAAQAFLKNASKRVVVDFAHDPLMPDKVREEAAALILKLQKK